MHFRNFISINSIMNKSYLQNLSKSELISLLLQMNKPTAAPIIKKRAERPTPAPRKSVKQLVQAYKNNIIAPPTEFQDDIIPPPPQFMDKPIPAPRTKRRDWSKRPVLTPRTKSSQTTQALTGYTKSYQIGIRDNEDPLVQLAHTRLDIIFVNIV